MSLRNLENEVSSILAMRLPPKPLILSNFCSILRAESIYCKKSAFHAHTLNQIRRSLNTLPNPQKCT